MIRKMVLMLPPMTAMPEGKPGACPRCGRSYLSRHGTVRRPMADTAVSSVEVQRYRCTSCGHTFRRYPPGVGRVRRTNRLTVLAALLHWLGLSFQASAEVLRRADASISPTSLWRGVNAMGVCAIGPRPRTRVHVLEPDESPEDCCEELLLRFVMDRTTGETIGVESWDDGAKMLPEAFWEYVRSSGGELVLSAIPEDRQRAS